jgi:hypothetical protein
MPSPSYVSGTSQPLAHLKGQVFLSLFTLALPWLSTFSFLLTLLLSFQCWQMPVVPHLFLFFFSLSVMSTE